jgi:hypothetical protein
MSKDVASMEAVEVWLKGSDVSLAPADNAKAKETYTIVKTYQAGPIPESILPQSAKRCSYFITVLGVVGTNGNVVLANSYADAQQVSAIYYASGAQLPANTQVSGKGQTEMWLVSPFANAPLVSVVSEYER